MNEIEIQEYQGILKAYLNKAQRLINNLEPNEDNATLYYRIRDVLANIDQTITIMDYTERKHK